MGFFSGLRRKVKKLIPKEIRPFAPYIAASFIPGGQGMMGLAKKFGTSAAARYLSDDEADAKDVLRSGIFAAAPEAISQGIGSAGVQNYFGEGSKTLSGLNKVGDFLGASDSGKMPSFAEAKLIGAQGSIDAGIKAAELNEDALAKYNADLARQGINDKAGRRAAIRAIYSNTGTWDMDEVDGMLDTYGYRTGGRVGYAMGDFVDTDQIVEDFQRIPSIGKGIGNLARASVDSLDKIIDVILNLPGMSGISDPRTGKSIIKILVERYGVDPEVAQRKIINRMSDANEGFGPQGLDGTPDDGYNPNIGIDSGAEDYYKNTPAMPENLGDMGGNMDDMSGAYETYTPRDIEQELEDLEKEPFNPYYPDMPRPVPMPTPDMPFREDMLNREYLMYGGRVGYDKGGFLKSGAAGGISLSDLVEDQIKNGDDEDMDYDEFDESLKYAKEGYDMLYPEIEAQPIRELRLADGGSTSDRLMDRVKELQDEGMDFASAMAQAQKEMGASRKASGGIMDAMDVNIQEQIDTPRGDIMVDENIEVAQDMDMPIQDLAEEFEITFGRPAESLEELKSYYQQKYGFNGDTSMMRRPGRTMAARGGIMDVNENMNINIPGVGDEDIDVNSMESIKGQTAGPDWYMDRLQNLEFLGYNYETAGEIAYDTDRYMRVIEMDIAPGPGEGDDDYATGGRVGKNQGGLMSMGGNEMDLRGGGFVPMGKAERADDVPARLSKNEFVMTADAVRAAGGGSVQKGADLMYDQMKQLEGQA